MTEFVEVFQVIILFSSAVIHTTIITISRWGVDREWRGIHMGILWPLNICAYLLGIEYSLDLLAPLYGSLDAIIHLIISGLFGISTIMAVKAVRMGIQKSV